MNIVNATYSQQNNFYDPRFACNGGGYDQPLIVVEFDDGAVFEIDDTSCGDFGSRIRVTAEIGGKKFCAVYGTMLGYADSNFGESEIPYLDLIAEKVGYGIPLDDI